MIESMIAVLFLGFGVGYWTKTVTKEPCPKEVKPNHCEFICFDMGMGGYDCCERVLPNGRFYDDLRLDESLPDSLEDL